ncbi:uncharacterized protein Dana_GF24930 [Drosophila ananassae]|uniref:AB hydrolase-1 domain-containing protein n=1 Tax=Drosophila ananassae TaxID=7217 RepID=B3M758_DROAN|nr:probable serine hydrolase [Drosophila ananassae]EDV38719.1 uncharacterized protein Dana_GF24930 [Drosophila ananassae]
MTSHLENGTKHTEPHDQEPMDVRIDMPWGFVVGRWYGNRQVRPILALHGWLDNLGTWDKLLPLLPRHLGVLCIDLPGHGYSSKLPEGIAYHFVDYLCVILRVMEEYGWQKVSLMAHSMSAMLCFIFASLYPHRTDMLVSIDIVKTRYRKPPSQIDYLRTNIEGYMLEDERFANAKRQEPPAYTYPELEQVLHKGSDYSVALENCRHILTRNISRSTKFPAKYFFSRDGRCKYYTEFHTSPPFAAELARTIRNVPYCVIKGSESNFIDEQSDEVIAILRENNPHFELHEVQGTHHVHLNNAEGVAAVINPFIMHHRPPHLETWTVDAGNAEEAGEDLPEAVREFKLKVEDSENVKRRKRKSNL